MIAHSDVIIAKNREGMQFSIGEEVMMIDKYNIYPSMIGQILIIEDILLWDNCESGFMIQIKHKESGNMFKKKLDTNWFKKIK